MGDRCDAGDFGESYRYGEPQSAPFWHSGFRSRCFWQSFPCSSSRAISVPLGILSARFAGKWVDTLTNCLTQILMAVPSFFLGMILTYVFGLILHMFQPGKFIEPSENFRKVCTVPFISSIRGSAAEDCDGGGNSCEARF